MEPIYGYEIGDSFVGTGTAAINGTTAIVLTGGAALTEFSPGDIIILNGESRVIDTVTDDDNMDSVTAFDTTASGLAVTGVTMKNLESDLGLTPQEIPAAPNTNDSFRHYTQPVDLASGGVRGNGWATTEWKFGFVTRALREALRVYCPEQQASADVWIRTRVPENGDEYRYYSATMIWPVPEKRDTGVRLEFVIEFRALVEIT